MNNDEEELVEQIPSEIEDQEIGVPIYKIISYPADPTLELLVDKLKREEIIIPKFQRGWVWKHVQASRLIESFLLGLPVPAIFVYKEPSEKQIVIDGQQRLRTIKGFFNRKLPDGNDFFLKGVSPQWEGKYYEDLTDTERIRLRDSVLREVIVQQIDPNDTTSIYHIFERLNTGGTGLTPQEVRNCTYHGAFNDLIVEVNKINTWRKIFGSDDVDKRMRDIEIIVRFFALFENSNSYTKPMKQFLNNFMARHQSDNDNKIIGFQNLFKNTTMQICKELGNKPFNLRRGINVAVCDAVMVAFARSNKIPDDILKRYQILLKNPSFIDSITQHTTDVDRVKNRIKLASEILFE